MREHGLGKKVSGVFTFDEIPYPKPNTYNLALEDCWIAYIEKESLGLGSSTIVVIRQDTGQVIYYGSAGDEG